MLTEEVDVAADEGGVALEHLLAIDQDVDVFHWMPILRPLGHLESMSCMLGQRHRKWCGQFDECRLACYVGERELRRPILFSTI